MAAYRDRIADRQVRGALATFGAVIIQGARATGKTTTGLHVAASSIRLDSSPELAALAETSPHVVLGGDAPRLIDEWQLAPTIWNAVRHEVDRRAVPGQFVLTGSATPSDDVTRHSGAGRFRRITLRPMTLDESGESTGEIGFASLFDGGSVAAIGGPAVPDYVRLAVRGGWPALVGQPGRSAREYLSSYLEDVVRVDLPGADLRVDPQRMRALVRALARNVATEIAATKLGAEAELSQPSGEAASISAQTVRKYLDALARVFVVEEQPAWAPRLRSRIRLRVQPKWHFADPSLAATALGAGERSLLDDLNTFGFLFESLCVRDLRVYADLLGGDVYHYRDDSGLEVDAIVELADGRWAAFEVKLGGARNVESAATSLRQLAAKVSEERRDQLCSLTVLTAGNTSYTREDGVSVVALGHLSAGSV
ncbi:ATP-binding protein [Xylanimonas sp. McL0601]|uniref:ATP-binding protein n=1 Tax=Xylanimonas sp. McL0601 TaxID=3414739 RepID=UPI003CEA4F9F